MSRLDVIGIGQVCADYLGRVHYFPDFEGKVELEEVAIRSGGPTATALLVNARFGMNVALIGKVGGDYLGMMIIRDLQKEGIDTSLIIKEKGKNTQVSFIPIEKETGRRTVFWSRGTITPLKPKDIKKKLLTQSRAIHFDELFVEVIIEAAQIAKKSGVVVSIDAGNYEEGIEELKGKIDLFIASNDFLREYSGEENPSKGIKKLREFGAKVTTVTLGSRGSLTIYNNEPIEIPAYPVRAVDTTGAGDVFHGAFLFGWLKGWEIRQILRFASAAAAINCLSLGAHSGVPRSSKQVLDFMKRAEIGKS
jgi:sulfofructose kinase